MKHSVSGDGMYGNCSASEIGLLAPRCIATEVMEAQFGN